MRRAPIGRRLLVEIDLGRLGYAPASVLRKLLVQAGEAIQSDGHDSIPDDQNGFILENSGVGRKRVAGTWKIETLGAFEQ